MKQKELEEQLGLVNRLTRIILSSSNLAEIGKGFVSELRELMSIDWGAIASIEGSSGPVHLMPLSSELDCAWEPGNTLPLEDSPIARIAQERRAFIEQDIPKGCLFPAERYLLEKGLRTVAYLPLFKAKKVFGAVILASRRPQAYKERELKLLKYATTQITAPVWEWRPTQEMEERIKAAEVHLSEEESERLISSIVHGVAQEIRKVFTERNGSIIQR